MIGPTAVDVVFTGALTHAENVASHFDCSFVVPRRSELEVLGEEASLFVRNPFVITSPRVELRRDGDIEPVDVEHGTPFVIHQPSYSLVNRWIEEQLLATLEELGIGGIVFSPLAQGLLTNRYLEGIPEGSRAATRGSALSPELLTEETMEKIRALNEMAERRGQSLARMAIAWTLRDSRVTSALIGASSVAQLEDSLAALDRLDFTEEELAEIDRWATESDINLWAESSPE